MNSSLRKAVAYFSLFTLPFSLNMAHAQFIIDGRSVPYDTLTHTWLATVPQQHFSHDKLLTVELADGWSDATIEGFSIFNLQSSMFNIQSTSRYHATAIDNQGKDIEGDIMFTFLPIIQLIGQFGYDYEKGTFIYSHPDSLRTDTLSAKIKWRGGTTNAEDKHKRNYKVKFPEDHRFLGLRDDNNWMLDAGQPDVFRMRNRIAMDLWNKMARRPYYSDKKPNARNGVRGDVVEVFLGDEYRGIYNFSEFIDRKQLKLNKVDEKTGEIHGCLYKGVSFDRTQMFNIFDSYDNTKETLYGYEIKYPELDDCDTVDWAPLVAANNFARGSTDEEFQQHVSEYFDMPVLLDYNIFFNVVNAVDNTGKNMYWAIYDKATTKCLTPTPWDLDATFGQRWGGLLVNQIEEGYFNSPEFKLDFELMLTYRLFRDNFNDYVGQMNERYKQLRQPGQPLYTDSIIAIVTRYYEAVKNSGAAAREEVKWSGDSDVWGDVIDFDSEYVYICDWIRRRMEFIDQTELPLFYKKAYFDEQEIRTPMMSLIEKQGGVYDLSGRKIDKSNINTLKPGLYIIGGKKYAINRKL